MNFKKLLFISTVSFLGISSAFAKEYQGKDGIYDNFNDYQKTLCSSSYEFGDISFREPFTIDGKEYYYYCEFTEPTKALDYVKNEYSDYLKQLKDDNALEELTESNWNDYYNIVSKMDTDEAMKLTIFFDTYENTNQNNEIEELVSNITSTTVYKSLGLTQSTSDKVEELNLLLPTYDDEIVSENAITPFATQTYNATNAVAYAKNYAWAPNGNYVYIEKGDCTNFVSQVLLAGGYNQVWGVNRYFGWWYKSADSRSHSWASASKFVKYWGIKDYYYDFQIFSKNVKVGSLIFLDQNDDGDYNHGGVVTYKAATMEAHTKDDGTILSYYDFVIAQHTDNYNGWVSEEYNHWENCTSTRSRYAIINIG